MNDPYDRKIDDPLYPALRLWAQWNLGDSAWANDIWDVVQDPEGTVEDIREQMKEDEE